MSERDNIAAPVPGAEVRFVGGLGRGVRDDNTTLERGIVNGEPIFTTSAVFIPIHVPGLDRNLLVDLENLR